MPAQEVSFEMPVSKSKARWHLEEVELVTERREERLGRQQGARRVGSLKEKSQEKQYGQRENFNLSRR